MKLFGNGKCFAGQEIETLKGAMKAAHEGRTMAENCGDESAVQFYRGYMTGVIAALGILRYPVGEITGTGVGK